MTIPTYPNLAARAYPVKRTPIWSTLKQKSISGQETRLQMWSYPQWRYELTYDFLRSDAAILEWQQVLGLYNKVGGAAQVFQFYDDADGAVSGQPFGVGDGVTTSFQLVRALGGFAEPVFAPVTTSVVTSLGGTLTTLSAGAGYTLGPTGAVIFASAPAAGTSLVWTGTFNWLCRFDNDEMEFQRDLSNVWSLKSAVFTTVKL
jgi:uncharacterized protein (TIGR02217 family)